ncbi:hypothetical protein F5Y01DRAFT_137019 [Xylaria sp. FL0043]|nr:hypothetical protein F5Y01DRAFT_137019 [Xylaria sp. FL0043]
MYTKKLSELTDEFEWNSWMGTTVSHMRDTGFEAWGFLVYRCTYGDDAAWDRYMQALKDEVHNNLVWCGREWLMEQYAQWTVIEDKETLDGAPKKEVRERFVQWRDEHSVSYELPVAAQIARAAFPTPRDASTRLPRFTYCLYVDQKCLDTLKAYLDAKANGTRASVVAVVIDGDYSPDRHTNPYRLYPNFEGCTDKYMGWMYTEASFLASLYDELHLHRLDLVSSYMRPPAVCPAGHFSM